MPTLPRVRHSLFPRARDIWPHPSTSFISTSLAPSTDTRRSATPPHPYQYGLSSPTMSPDPLYYPASLPLPRSTSHPSFA
eukprot:scaffold185360_cov30-Tisochrysis_lutea.AAC.1